MHRRALAAFSLGALSLCPVWSGCAEQADSAAQRAGEATGATAAASGSGGDAGSATAGSAAGGKVGSAGTTASGGGGAASAGTAPIAGTEPGAGGAGGDSPSGGAGGDGGADAGCKVPVDCDDDNPCTTEACLLGHCSHTSNTTACADDKNACTADICGAGVCTHPDNKLCECQKDADCLDDKNICTDEHCNDAKKCEHNANTLPCADDKDSCTTDVCAAKVCTHADNGSCGVGKAFTVDSFNSSADWLAAKTTPDLRAIVVTGVNATNLEGNADLWIAEADTGTIEFALASMAGLAKLRIVIRSTAADTGGMVFVGLWNGTAWVDKALSAYAAIPTVNYATIEVPTADFGQQLTDVTKLRLRFAVTGGEKTWQIDEISTAK